VAHVTVLATGGTIASSQDSPGVSVANRNVQDLLSGLTPTSVTIDSRDVLKTGSYLLTHANLRLICEAVADALAREDVDGVVLAHGTDTMEETAYLLDLIHDSAKPVVLTGAQKPADMPDSDGTANLRDALKVAAHPGARNKGVMIAFAGMIFPARGTLKVHTVSPAPFRTMNGGPVGHIDGDRVVFTADPVRPPALLIPDQSFDGTRVDIISVHAGADAALAKAAVEAGACGVIIAGTGVGNGNHALVEWVGGAVRAGLAVGLASRVLEGPVQPNYGNGGGADLVRAGAVLFGSLPLSQARILSALLLSQNTHPTARSIEPYIH
jgi:L-asparaginase